MTRTLTAGMTNQVVADTAELLYLYELQLSGGTVRYCTGTHDTTWNGLTWTGVGGALQHDAIQEAGDLSSGHVLLTLSGVDRALISVLLTQGYLGRGVKIYLGSIDVATMGVMIDPIPVFTGYLNGGWSIHERRSSGAGGGNNTVTIECRLVDRLSDLDLRKGLQTNLQSHQAVFSTDKFFEFVPSLASKRIVWSK